MAIHNIKMWIILILTVGLPCMATAANVALGKPATQSSTFPGTSAYAALAVDGNTDGVYGHGSVTHTNFDSNPWWQVDLGSSIAIDSIVVWNRTDCCSDRLQDYWIFISDVPFTAGDTPASLVIRPGTVNIHQTSAPNPSTTIPLSPGIQGRYVRVQIQGNAYLSLAEVQVTGTAPGPLSDLTITNTHLGTFVKGQIGAMYTITVTNLGTGFTGGLVTVTDAVPVGLTPINISGSGWLCTQPSGPCTIADPLGPGASYSPITLTVNVDSNALSNLTPTATVSGGSDANPNNNTAPDFTTIATDLALGRPVSQSSTIVPNTGADKAVDGNTNGNYGVANSISHTNLEATPWWQVDLGSNATIGSIVIWNRTDCCGDRLSDFWVFVSNTPFSPAETPATLQNRPGTWSAHLTSAPNPYTSIPTPLLQGRYVRVQLNGANYLALAEVQVLGVPGPIQPDLVITKSHNGNFTQGQIGATYTITVSNYGNQATTGMVTVTESLPYGLTGASISGPGWACTQPSGPCTRNDSLAAASSYPALTLTVNVAPNAPSIVTNMAAVSGGGEPGPDSNDSAFDQTTITTPGGSTPTNLALSKPASQSSTAAADTTADKAVDGNLNGNYGAAHSISHTNFDANAWWQVDLGAVSTISSVVVWNRTDCCGDRLGDYWVFISNNPFLPTDTPATLQSRGDTWSSHQMTAPNPSTTITVPSIAGRYVRIQLNGTNYLSLAELQVIGVATAPAPDLTVAKSHVGNFAQGQFGATYTITVTNGGTLSTSGVVSVTDTLPSGLTASGIAGPGWACTQPGGPCTRSDALPAGSSYPPITLTVNVAPAALASVTNSVTVSGGGETNTTNNTATDPTTVTPAGVSTNLAVGRFAEQSSTASGNTPASKAVDGNTNGDYFAASSISHTNYNTNAWWQVDLGTQATIGSVVVWNRTDCCGDRLSDFWVFISPTPFGPTETPATLQFRANTWNAHLTSAPNPSTAIPVAAFVGRYVRIQLTGTNFLALAEVQVNGVAGAPLPDLTITKSHTGDFTRGQNGVTYTTTVTNAGIAPTGAMVTVTENVPAGLNAVSIGGSGWSCTQPSGPCSRNDALGAGLSYPPITLTANVDPAAPSVLTNTATVSGGGETDATNDTAADATTILPGGGPVNLASGKSANQSSTILANTGPEKAVDGNTSGNYPVTNSISHTNFNANAWWQVDLGASATLSSIVVWNRTDCCGDRLSDYWVFVSDLPFGLSDTPATLQNRANTWSIHQTSAPNPSTTIPTPTVRGRYVRVQLSGTNYLSLAEVQVMSQ